MNRDYKKLFNHLDERTRRLVLASDADAFGRGGITAIGNASGASRNTITQGLKELNGKLAIAKNGHVRKTGGGRKKKADTDTTLKADLIMLLSDNTRGDPMCALLWTTKSVRNLESALKEMGHEVSRKIVNELLWEMGYSLQSNRKADEGSDNPFRDQQFRYINAKAREFQSAGQPVISVDCKKHENIGNYKNSGTEWREKGKPEVVNTYDFVGELGKAYPYGVYDPTLENGMVNVGVTHDTAEFAVASIRLWWEKMGKGSYQNATRLFITADGGGSNGSRTRLWKTELQKFATETGLEIFVSHYPPGTSKWNKIEHRMFSAISMNWRGKPLRTLETIVNLIANATTTTGLKINCQSDTNDYPTGIKISDEELKAVNLTRDDTLGCWNYNIRPNIAHVIS